MEDLQFPIGKCPKHEQIDEQDLAKWMNTIKTFPHEVEHLVNSLEAEAYLYRYRPGGWTISQVVHHCADSHMNSYMRFKLALTEENPSIKPYEEAEWAKMKDANEIDLSASLSLLKGLHHRWYVFLNNMSTLDWEKCFYHPESEDLVRLDKNLGIYDWHCRHHLAHIKLAINSKSTF